MSQPNKLRFSIFTICLLNLTILFGQTAKPDTVFVKRSISKTEFEIDTLYIRGGNMPGQVLAGTTFLPSDKMLGLMLDGLTPIKFEILEECNNGIDPKSFPDYPKFISVKKQEDTLAIDVTIVSNCCGNFLGEAEVVGKDTLNLIYTHYGGGCSCDCCFTLRYKFKIGYNINLESDDFILRNITINGNKKCIGKIPGH